MSLETLRMCLKTLTLRANLELAGLSPTITQCVCVCVWGGGGGGGSGVAMH